MQIPHSNFKNRPVREPANLENVRPPRKVHPLITWLTVGALIIVVLYLLATYSYFAGEDPLGGLLTIFIFGAGWILGGVGIAIVLVLLLITLHNRNAGGTWLIWTLLFLVVGGFVYVWTAGTGIYYTRALLGGLEGHDYVRVFGLRLFLESNHLDTLLLALPFFLLILWIGWVRRYRWPILAFLGLTVVTLLTLAISEVFFRAHPTPVPVVVKLTKPPELPSVTLIGSPEERRRPGQSADEITQVELGYFFSHIVSADDLTIDEETFVLHDTYPPPQYFLVWLSDGTHDYPVFAFTLDPGSATDPSTRVEDVTAGVFGWGGGSPPQFSIVEPVDLATITQVLVTFEEQASPSTTLDLARIRYAGTLMYGEPAQRAIKDLEAQVESSCLYPDVWQPFHSCPLVARRPLSLEGR